MAMGTHPKLAVNLQATAIPFRRRRGRLEFCLITTPSRKMDFSQRHRRSRRNPGTSRFEGSFRGSGTARPDHRAADRLVSAGQVRQGVRGDRDADGSDAMRCPLDGAADATTALGVRSGCLPTAGTIRAPRPIAPSHRPPGQPARKRLVLSEKAADLACVGAGGSCQTQPPPVQDRWGAGCQTQPPPVQDVQDRWGAGCQTQPPPVQDVQDRWGGRLPNPASTGAGSVRWQGRWR
jgi:hypothetical protein